MIRNVTLNLSAGGKAEILMNGENLAEGVGGVTLRARAGEFPVLELELLAREYMAEGGWRVEISDRTASILERMGWTPPQDALDGGKA